MELSCLMIGLPIHLFFVLGHGRGKSKDRASRQTQTRTGSTSHARMASAVPEIESWRNLRDTDVVQQRIFLINPFYLLRARGCNGGRQAIRAAPLKRRARRPTTASLDEIPQARGRTPPAASRLSSAV